MKSVSVIIPALNEEKYIEKSLSSLKNQDYGSGFETIVVDGRSTDRTREIAQEFGAKIVDCPKKNIGFSRNLGVKASKGDALLFLDADTIAPRNWISRHLEEYGKDHQTVMAGSLYRFDETLYYSLYRPLNLGRKVLYSLAVPYLPTSSMSVRRDVFYAVGGFVEEACEDADMSLKAKKFGKVKIIDDLTILTSSRDWRREHSIVKHYVFNPVYALTRGKINLVETMKVK